MNLQALINGQQHVTVDSLSPGDVIILGGELCRVVSMSVHDDQTVPYTVTLVTDGGDEPDFIDYKRPADTVVRVGQVTR